MWHIFVMHLFVCFCFILGHLLLLSLVSYMHLVIKPTDIATHGLRTVENPLNRWEWVFGLTSCRARPTRTSGPTLWAASERDSGWGLTIPMPGWVLLAALKKSEVDTEYLHVVEYLEVNSCLKICQPATLMWYQRGCGSSYSTCHHRGVVLVALTCRCGIGCT